MFKEISESIRVGFYLFNELVWHVGCSIDKAISWADEAHWFIILNELALIKYKNGSNNVQRVESIKLIDNIPQIFNASVIL